MTTLDAAPEKLGSNEIATTIVDLLSAGTIGASDLFPIIPFTTPGSKFIHEVTCIYPPFTVGTRPKLISLLKDLIEAIEDLQAGLMEIIEKHVPKGETATAEKGIYQGNCSPTTEIFHMTDDIKDWGKEGKLKAGDLDILDGLDGQDLAGINTLREKFNRGDFIAWYGWFDIGNALDRKAIFDPGFLQKLRANHLKLHKKFGGKVEEIARATAPKVVSAMGLFKGFSSPRIWQPPEPAANLEVPAASPETLAAVSVLVEKINARSESPEQIAEALQQLGYILIHQNDYKNTPEAIRVLLNSEKAGKLECEDIAVEDRLYVRAAHLTTPHEKFYYSKTYTNLSLQALAEKTGGKYLKDHPDLKFLLVEKDPLNPNFQAAMKALQQADIRYFVKFKRIPAIGFELYVPEVDRGKAHGLTVPKGNLSPARGIQRYQAPTHSSNPATNPRQDAFAAPAYESESRYGVGVSRSYDSDPKIRAEVALMGIKSKKDGLTMNGTEEAEYIQVSGIRMRTIGVQMITTNERQLSISELKGAIRKTGINPLTDKKLPFPKERAKFTFIAYGTGLIELYCHQ